MLLSAAPPRPLSHIGNPICFRESLAATVDIACRAFGLLNGHLSKFVDDARRFRGIMSM